MKLATIQVDRCGPSCQHDAWNKEDGAICNHTLGLRRQTWKAIKDHDGKFPIWCPLPDAPEGKPDGLQP